MVESCDVVVVVVVVSPSAGTLGIGMLGMYYVTAKVGWTGPLAEVEGTGETLRGVCVGSHHSDAPESRFPSFFPFVSPCPSPPLFLSSLALSASVLPVCSFGQRRGRIVCRIGYCAVVATYEFRMSERERGGERRAGAVHWDAL